MLWLITATNADGSYRQWAERIDIADSVAHRNFAATAIALAHDPHVFNPGHSNTPFPFYEATPL